jgi:hypothetical protein
MSIPKAALCASLFLLASCAKPSNPPLLPPSLCTEVRPEPQLPDGAGLVAPVTDAEKDATRDLLAWASEVLDWGREGWDRAGTARGLCG